MSKIYTVPVNVRGKERKLRFDSMDKAKAFCNEVFARLNIVLTIIQEG